MVVIGTHANEHWHEGFCSILGGEETNRELLLSARVHSEGFSLLVVCARTCATANWSFFFSSRQINDRQMSEQLYLKATQLRPQVSILYKIFFLSHSPTININVFSIVNYVYVSLFVYLFIIVYICLYLLINIPKICIFIQFRRSVLHRNNCH